MVLRDDRKGVVSIVDAMIFVTLIAVVSMCLFSFFVSEHQEEPMAKTVCDDLISVELKASDVFDTEDSDVYRISDLIATGMVSGRTDRVESYVSQTLDGLIPKMHGYELTISYDGKTMTFAREGGQEMTSEYSVDTDIVNGKTMGYYLKIF